MCGEHIMFCKLTGVKDKGMLTELRHVENPMMPEMKCVMKILHEHQETGKGHPQQPQGECQGCKALTKEGRKMTRAGQSRQTTPTAAAP